jgi:phosphate transport system substrate-binding protein
MKTMCRILTLLTVAIAVLLSSVCYTFASISIGGAGSTFIYPVFVKGSEAYGKVAPDVRITYQSVGSLQGGDQLLGRTTQFAASDAPLHLEQMNEPDCRTLYFPVVVGAVVIVYDLPELRSSRLRLTGEVLSKIYLGKIKNWNDPAIAALNPNTQLPCGHPSRR